MRTTLLAGLLLAVITGPVAAEDNALTGYWRGTYDCAQGLTGINLTIRQGAGSSVDAVFQFYAVPQNRTVPDGCFRMQGQYDANTRAFSLTSDNGQWIVRPYGYVVVDFHGSLNADGQSMHGEVDGPGCSQFDLQRLDRPPPAPVACSEALSASISAPSDVAAR